MTWAFVGVFALGGLCGAAGTVLALVAALNFAIREGLGV